MTTTATGDLPAAAAAHHYHSCYGYFASDALLSTLMLLLLQILLHVLLVRCAGCVVMLCSEVTVVMRALFGYAETR
jgi:uncharacterized membrane protein